MAKKTLSERFVQDAVAERLNRDYYKRKPAYVATEEYTRLKRADVFLAFMRARKRPYVVVVEAKSRTTIHQLKLKEAPHRVRWAGRATTAVLIGALMAALGYQWYFNAVNTLVLLGIFVAGSSLISALLRRLDLSSLSSVSVIEQLGRYPANEKWIAVGEDTFAKPEQFDILYKQCKKNGLGLLVVTARGKVQRRLIPTPRHTFNNYLDSYGKEDKILAAIDKRNADYGPTPPERAKQFRQFVNAGALLALVGFLALLTYEENYRPVLPDPFAEEYTATVAAEAEEPAAPVVEPVANDTLPSEPTAADCADFRVDRRSFIVVDALLNPANVAARVAELRAAGIEGFRTVPTDCLNSWPAPGRVAIYRDTVFSSRPAANRVARQHRSLLKEKGVAYRYGKAVKVRPR